MNIVNIDEAKVREAAEAGLDEFVDLFANSAIDSVGGNDGQIQLGPDDADCIQVSA